MSSEYIPDGSAFAATVTMPSDGEPADALHLNVGSRDLGDRTEHLKKLCDQMTDLLTTEGVVPDIDNVHQLWGAVSAMIAKIAQVAVSGRIEMAAGINVEATDASGNGLHAIASGSADGVYGKGGPTNGIGVHGVARGSLAAGVFGEGSGGGPGLLGKGGDNGAGVRGEGGSASGIGVHGIGDNNSDGVFGEGQAGHNGKGVHGIATGTAAGVHGEGGTDGGSGVLGEGDGAGAGVVGKGGTSGKGVSGTGQGSADGTYGKGGDDDGTGVHGLGGGTGIGVLGEGGASGGIGIKGVGAGNADGVRGEGNPAGNGTGVHGKGTGSHSGVFGEGGAGGGKGVHGIGEGAGAGVRAEGGASGSAVEAVGYYGVSVEAGELGIDVLMSATATGAALQIVHSGTGYGLWINGSNNKAAMHIASQTGPVILADGDFWFDGANLKVRIGGDTYTLDKTIV
jgi:hypothetical protein